MELRPGTEEMIAGIEVALHDLCQPLTVLQCKLEISLLMGGEEATQAAVIDGFARMQAIERGSEVDARADAAEDGAGEFRSRVQRTVRRWL